MIRIIIATGTIIVLVMALFSFHDNWAKLEASPLLRVQRQLLLHDPSTLSFKVQVDISQQKEKSSTAAIPFIMIESLTEVLHNRIKAGANNVFQDISVAGSLGDFSLFSALSDKLVTESFSGKKMVFIGDSTLVRVGRKITCLLERACNKFYGTSDNWNNTSAKAANDILKLDDESSQDPRIFHSPNLSFFGFTGGVRDEDFAPILDNAWEETQTNLQPDILVVNEGFHWLHVITHKWERGAEAIMFWIHYETKWLQRVIDEANNLASKRPLMLLFKTNNFICNDMQGNYARFDGVDDYAPPASQATLTTCYRIVRNTLISKGYRGSKSEIDDYCLNGVFSDHGSRYLNHRLYKFLSLLNLEDFHPDLKIGILNDYDLETCGTTDDSYHHFQISLPRIRLLGNVIEYGNKFPAQEFNKAMQEYSNLRMDQWLEFAI